jgi:hypothetical protein
VGCLEEGWCSSRCGKELGHGQVDVFDDELSDYLASRSTAEDQKTERNRFLCGLERIGMNQARLPNHEHKSYALR